MILRFKCVVSWNRDVLVCLTPLSSTQSRLKRRSWLSPRHRQCPCWTRRHRWITAAQCWRAPPCAPSPSSSSRAGTTERWAATMRRNSCAMTETSWCAKARPTRARMCSRACTTASPNICCSSIRKARWALERFFFPHDIYYYWNQRSILKFDIVSQNILRVSKKCLNHVKPMPLSPIYLYLQKVRTKDHIFESISHLIGHHRDNNLPIVSAGSELCLKQPVERKQWRRPSVKSKPIKKLHRGNGVDPETRYLNNECLKMTADVVSFTATSFVRSLLDYVKETHEYRDDARFIGLFQLFCCDDWNSIFFEQTWVHLGLSVF